ncbi:MAG: hypothetical protein R2734_11895 [Nocardioides sp.]
MPALVEGAGELDVKSQAAKMLVLVPTALAGLLGLAVVSSIASRWPRADGGSRRSRSRSAPPPTTSAPS